ncbi:VacJ family lipoprotein [bacterium]|nr:VacJ family lipoprotein [bacterium]MBU1884047.1 VacJ family lipoprotein [bacterium]
MRYLLLLLFVVIFSSHAESIDDFDDEYVEKKQEPFDPLSGYNRVMTNFNDYLYMNILDPYLFKGYDYVAPKVVRSSIQCFFDNLKFPITFVNNLLQLKFKRAWVDIERFGVNTTIGLFGFFDPASTWLKLEKSDEDFGQTLGYYGVGSGFPITLPFFGQYNLRDLVGVTADAAADPLYYDDYRKYNMITNKYEAWGIVVYKQFNEGSLRAKEYKEFRKDAIDLYPFIRDAYEQNRNMLIKE